MIGSGFWDYFNSPYNYFDLATYALPLAGAVIIFVGNDLPTDLCAWTVLVLWIHMVSILDINFFLLIGFNVSQHHFLFTHSDHGVTVYKVE